MATEVLKEIKTNLLKTDQAIKDAKALITVLDQAGENTTEIKNRFRELERKREKWLNAIQAAGY